MGPDHHVYLQITRSRRGLVYLGTHCSTPRFKRLLALADAGKVRDLMRAMLGETNEAVVEMTEASRFKFTAYASGRACSGLPENWTGFSEYKGRNSP